jgi:hypothetical protein
MGELFHRRNRRNRRNRRRRGRSAAEQQLALELNLPAIEFMYSTTQAAHSTQLGGLYNKVVLL